MNFRIGMLACLELWTALAQTPAEIALRNEPDWKLIEAAKLKQRDPNTINTGGVGIMQILTATEGIHRLEDHLEFKLRHELLYECHGKCPVKEKELGLIRNIIDADDTRKPLSAKQKAERDFTYHQGDDPATHQIVAYCNQMNGDPRGKKDGPERTEGLARVEACYSTFHLVQDARGKFHGGPEAEHQKVQDECAANFYDLSKNIYNQGPYDECMNRKDLYTQLCSKLMKARGEAGYCPGPQPEKKEEPVPVLPPGLRYTYCSIDIVGETRSYMSNVFQINFVSHEVLFAMTLPRFRQYVATKYNLSEAILGQKQNYYICHDGWTTQRAAMTEKEEELVRRHVNAPRITVVQTGFNVTP